MDSRTPIDIKCDIVKKSKQDCIDGVNDKISSAKYIPLELFDVLINNVKPYANMSESSENYFHIVSGISSFNDYTEDMYWFINKLLLYLEFYQRIMDMKQYNLYNQMITPSERHENEFNIRVPGLSEERPSLRAQDKVEIYEANGINRTISEIVFVGQEYVSVCVNREFKKKFCRTQKYHIEFIYFDRDIRNLNFILNKVYDEKLTPMLFPIEKPLSKKKILPIKWINRNIEKNPEQQQAVINILHKTAHPAPYILFGPPGTGKTSTLVEAICQIMKDNSKNRVLICTPSNAAADEIAMRLCKQSVDEKIMYRMYCKSKDADTVNDNIKPFSNVADTGTVFIANEVFLRKRIVITTLSTCMRLYKYKFRENHFSYVFCDEAGQATELETLIPMALKNGVDSDNCSRFCAQIVLAGDPLQLGPVVSSRLAQPLLGKSMLERLIKWGPYEKSKETNKYNPMYITKLIQNYRSHPAILNLPNNLFYDGELIAMAGNEARRAECWAGLEKRNFPVIFHAVKGEEKRQKNSPSVCNYAEVRIVTNYVKRLLNIKLGKKIVTKNDIGIITPYKLQKNKIQKALEDEKINDISVGTVEIFQGQERDIIIISSVRTKLYMNNGHIHIGFLSHPKRFNVAITRARALLIVVGAPEILQHDESWRAFLQYCIDNKSCTGRKFKLQQYVNKSKIRNLIAKKHIVNQPEVLNSAEPIVEQISDTEIEGEFKIDENRRRRLPFGPLPSNCSDNNGNNLRRDSENDSRDKFYLKLENKYDDRYDDIEYNDEYEKCSSEDGDDGDNDDGDDDDDESDSDDYYSALNKCSPASPTDTFVSTGSENIQDNYKRSFEEQLKDRMMTLISNDIFEE